MNNIDVLIAELCPNGVEFRGLGEMCEFMNGKGHEKHIIENGKYIVVNSKFVSTDGNVKKYSDQQLSPIFINDILMVMSDLPKGKALAKCFVVDKDDTYTLNQRIGALTVKDRSKTDSMFLYYILNRNKQLLRFDNGADQTNLRKDDILNISIPIPPLPIQQEIVTILDEFTQLQAELQAELQARRAQYEYYRNDLLNFEDKEVEWSTLGEVCIVSSGGTPSKAEKSYWTNGTIPWLRSEVCKEKSVFSANDKITELGLKKSGAKLFCQSTTLMALVGATKCKTAFLEFEATTNQNIAGIKSKDENLLLDKFVFYYLMNLYKELIKNLGQYDMLNLGQIREYQIPIPPLAEQNRIVAILDKFDKLVNDISEGLPAEIQARLKQYEYYRGKLLDFKSMSNG